MFPILPLFVEASGSGTAEADNGFDAVLPFDQGVVAVATVKGTDGVVGLGRHKCLTATDGFRVVGTVKREDVPQTIDLAEPDGMRHVWMNGSNQGIRVAVQHWLT